VVLKLREETEIRQERQVWNSLCKVIEKNEKLKLDEYGRGPFILVSKYFTVGQGFPKKVINRYSTVWQFCNFYSYKKDRDKHIHYFDDYIKSKIHGLSKKIIPKHSKIFGKVRNTST
jgi:hypothetical protein